MCSWSTRIQPKVAGDHLTAGKMLASQFKKGNWRIFAISSTPDEQSDFRFDVNTDPKQLSEQVEHKMKELKIKFDAILCLSPYDGLADAHPSNIEEAYFKN